MLDSLACPFCPDGCPPWEPPARPTPAPAPARLRTTPEWVDDFWTTGPGADLDFPGW
jgi:hypothetical protein